MEVADLIYRDLIAPCGMNCGICIGHLRERKPCAGCIIKDDENKPKHCRSCAIANCEYLSNTTTGFCYDCEKFPCVRLKRLDKRYRLKYRMSMIENLESIRDKGMEQFLANEEKRWTCSTCGKGLSAHRNFCLYCKAEVN